MIAKDGYANWHDLPATVNFGEFDFQIAIVKINEIVYTKYDAEFAKAFNEAKVWDRLSYDSI